VEAKLMKDVVKKDIPLPNQVKCPKCGMESCLSVVVPVPLVMKVLFFVVTLGLNISISYCPRCGYLSVSVKSA
jgi:predicted nucleic-acid-binding Zn-ribbon protein